MIVVDTSIIVAYMNAADDFHAAVAGWLDGADEDLATTPLIIAEVDYLVGARGGPASAYRPAPTSSNGGRARWPPW